MSTLDNIKLKPVSKKPRFKKLDYKAAVINKPGEVVNPLDLFRRAQETYVVEKITDNAKCEQDISNGPAKRKQTDELDGEPSDSGDNSDEGGSCRRRKNAKIARARYQYRTTTEETVPKTYPERELELDFRSRRSKQRIDISNPSVGLQTIEKTNQTTDVLISDFSDARTQSAKEYACATGDILDPHSRFEDNVVTMEPTEDDAYFASLAERARKQLSQVPSSSEQLDPVLQILVSSPIEKTQPVILKRRHTQTLKQVRQAWCNYNKLTPEQASHIFFIWKGNKVFDYVSSKGIGVKIDESGNLFLQDGVDYGPNGGLNVHLEAVTKEILESREMADEDGLDDGPEDFHQKEVKISLIIKAKGMKESPIKIGKVGLPIIDVLCTFNPHIQTKCIEDLVRAFREYHAIKAEKKITLTFDGDDLHLSDTIQDTELEDTFVIDAYIY